MKLGNAYKSKEDEYYSLSRPEVQRWIKPNQNAILDVGCGNGQMAYELKTTKNIKEVWGIEPMERFGKQAIDRLDNVLVMQVEDAIDWLPEKKFDTIIFADVLEHLVDPERVLIELKSKLTDCGEIITSIPNTRHWLIFKQLLEGDWQYTEHGLLDKTHLRFFTKKSIDRMFRTCGYFPQFLGSQKVGNVIVPDDMLKRLAEAGLNVETLNDELNDFQYFVRAKLGINAIFIPSQLLNQQLLNKIESFPAEIKSEIKIVVIYQSTSPMIEFIKSMNDPEEAIIAVHRSEIDFSNYSKLVLLNNIDFNLNEFKNKYFSFSGISIANQDFVLTSPNSADFNFQVNLFLNNIR